MDFEIVHQILLRLSRIVGVVSINILIDAMNWCEIGYNELVRNIICKISTLGTAISGYYDLVLFSNIIVA